MLSIFSLIFIVCILYNNSNKKDELFDSFNSFKAFSKKENNKDIIYFDNNYLFCCLIFLYFIAIFKELILNVQL